MSVTDEVKQRLDIVAVVSSYIPLSKSGRNFKANCPFHTEKTPSFYVFPDTQTWRCFGACATGGDLLSFVMRRDQLDFGEALRLMAARAGVVLRERTQAPPEEEAHLTRLRSANQAAALFFHSLLLNHSEAAYAREYVEQRGLNPETVRGFMLGYSLPGWDGLKKHLEQLGYSSEELLEAGLLSQSERGIFDRFRNRLMFPIWDAQGETIGFGARELDGSVPKYLNTNQTPLFDKSGTVYALDRAKDAVRQQRQVVIVEGYMDVIMAHQHGFRNVVASMGTSLTEKQVSALARHSTTIILALDSDTAGQSATIRGLEILPKIVEARHGEIRVLELQEGKDPDELIRRDAKLWEQAVTEAVPMIDYFINIAQKRFTVADAKGKAETVDSVSQLIAALPDKTQQTHYLQKVASLLGLNETALFRSLPRTRRVLRNDIEADAPVWVRQSLEKADTIETFCLGLLLRFEFLRPEASFLRDDHFMSIENREIFRCWQQSPEALATLEEGPLQEQAGFLLEDNALQQITGAMAQAALAQCVHRLEERRLRDLKLHHRLRFAQEEPETDTREVASAAYSRWQGRQEGSPADAEDAESDLPLVAVQEQEMAVNQQIFELMKQRRLPPTEIPLLG